MKMFTAFIEFVTRFSPFTIPSVIGGHRVEINRRIHIIMYGTDRD